MLTTFLLTVLILTGFIIFLWTCKSCIEPFQNQESRPWFGYEPGYGPGWGRKPCCDQAVPKNMGNI